VVALSSACQSKGITGEGEDGERVFAARAIGMPEGAVRLRGV